MQAPTHTGGLAARLSSKHKSRRSANADAAKRDRKAANGFRERFGKEVNEEEQRRRLAILRTEHRDLDAAIAALSASDSQDQLQIARLKKRKLRLRDQIAAIEDFLTPDIIA